MDASVPGPEAPEAISIRTDEIRISGSRCCLERMPSLCDEQREFVRLAEKCRSVLEIVRRVLREETMREGVIRSVGASRLGSVVAVIRLLQVKTGGRHSR